MAAFCASHRVLLGLVTLQEHMRAAAEWEHVDVAQLSIQYQQADSFAQLGDVSMVAYIERCDCLSGLLKKVHSGRSGPTSFQMANMVQRLEGPQGARIKPNRVTD